VACGKREGVEQRHRSFILHNDLGRYLASGYLAKDAVWVLHIYMPATYA
jgi:hypothetical protein